MPFLKFLAFSRAAMRPPQKSLCERSCMGYPPEQPPQADTGLVFPEHGADCDLKARRWNPLVVRRSQMVPTPEVTAMGMRKGSGTVFSNAVELPSDIDSENVAASVHRGHHLPDNGRGPPDHISLNIKRHALRIAYRTWKGSHQIATALPAW